MWPFRSSTLPMPTAVDDGSTHLDLSVTVEPLLSQHGDERGEGNGQAGANDGLDVDDSRIRASPLGKSGVVAGWDVPERDGTGRDCGELDVCNQVVGCHVDDEADVTAENKPDNSPRKTKLTP